MSCYEKMAIILSISALIVSIVNTFVTMNLTNKYHRLVEEQNNISREQNKISLGQSETQIRELIMNARKEVSDVSEKIAQNIAQKNSDELNKVYLQMLEAAQEDLRNSYEEACSRYRDEKIDKERFKRMYLVEIKNLVEDKGQSLYFDAVTSRYKCILKVYDEWNDLER